MARSNPSLTQQHSRKHKKSYRRARTTRRMKKYWAAYVPCLLRNTDLLSTSSRTLRLSRHPLRSETDSVAYEGLTTSLDTVIPINLVSSTCVVVQELCETNSWLRSLQRFRPAFQSTGVGEGGAAECGSLRG